MLFNSLIFWEFFSVFFFAYYLASGRIRLWVCLIGSYIFYATWDWRFLGLICGFTLLVYLLGIYMDKASAQFRRIALVFGLATSIGLLCLFKYANFLLSSINGILPNLTIISSTSHLDIILPVGISFYSFQAMAYLIDLYRGHIAAEQSLLRFATFKSFFPQIVAGPIVRAATFLPQLQHDIPFDWNRFVAGACAVAWGFVLKVVLADSLSTIVDSQFASPEAASSLSLLIAVVFYSFQIYGDFAGYSLMAIGLARIFGYDFGINFDRPYFSASFSEFWRRWHISLSFWLRDYLYIPLGGNRNGSAITILNLMITMVLGGLWHGAAWTFVIWGALHGIYLCIQRQLGKQWAQFRGSLPRPLYFLALFAQILLVFSLTSVAWVFFRAQSLEQAVFILDRIVTQGNWSFSSLEQRFIVIKGMAFIAAVIAIEGISFRIDYRAVANKHTWLVGVFLMVCALTISLFGTFSGNAFIYFQF